VCYAKDNTPPNELIQTRIRKRVDPMVPASVAPLLIRALLLEAGLGRECDDWRTEHIASTRTFEKSIHGGQCPGMRVSTV